MATQTGSVVDLAANSQRQRNYELIYRESVDPWDYSSYADRVRFQCIADAARKWCPHPRRSLDVACGLGQLTVLLAEFSDEVFAYDFAPSAVQRTRERCEKHARCKIDVEVRDAMDPGYERNIFDLIALCDMNTDGDMDWWSHVLKAHKELLSQGGTMVVSGRIKPKDRSGFENSFLSMGGTLLDRVYFHDRYWYKARSVIKRAIPPHYAKTLLAQRWFFQSATTIGRMTGPKGSIHFGVVVRFTER